MTGPAEKGLGVHHTLARPKGTRAQGARKSSGFRVKFWYRTRDGNRSGQPALVGLLIGSKFFDRPVKPVEKPVEFSFLATKRHLSTNRNILIYFITN